jgi:HEAT repeat protein
VRSRFLLLAPLVGLATLGITPAARALVWPDVFERVEKAMHSTDREERRAGARQLADVGRERAAPLVLEALSDTDDDVRIEAAKSAIVLRVEGATDAVLPWLGERDPRFRIVACEVARAMPSARAVPVLARALGDNDANVRAATAEALGAQKSPEAVAPLIGKLDDQSPPVRIQVIRALARLGDKRAVVPLVGKVQDSVADVRGQIARALGTLDDARAISALVLLLRDTVNEVRVDALKALAHLHAQSAIDPIAQLVTERVPQVRHAAIAALGHIGGDQATAALVGLLGSGEDGGAQLDSTPVRRALVSLGPAAVPLVAKVLDRPDSPAAATSAAWTLRALSARSEEKRVRAALERGVLPVPAALYVLAGIGGPDALPVVLEFISDPSPAVRHEALLAAKELLDPEKPDGRAVEPITAALRDTRISQDDRLLLVEILGRTGAPRAREALFGLLPTKDIPVRLAAIDAIGMLGRSEGGTPLTQLLSDPLPTVRLHAALALAKVGGAKEREEIILRLKSDEENDAFSLFVALSGIEAKAPGEPGVLADLFAVSAAGQRDMVLEAIGRMPREDAPAWLERLTATASDDDRRMAAVMLANHAKTPAGRALLLKMATSPQVDVRAQAAWSLGAGAGPEDVPRLHALAQGSDADVTIDALGAIARIAARANDKTIAQRELCAFLEDRRIYVRHNALAGLALAGSRCEDGARERRALEDPSDIVRDAAARAVSNVRDEEDKRALVRCRDEERVSAIASRCESSLASPFAAPKKTATVTAYVVPDRDAPPRALAPYTIQLADGLVRVGVSDRRGAIADPAAPEGTVTLLPPSALAR